MDSLKVAIHQPYYFPYPGFFHKISISDIFVVMDKTQFDKTFGNRNKIIIPGGWTWITVPILKEHKFSPSNLVEINNEMPWKERQWKQIQRSYNNSKFFKLYKDYFENIFNREWKMLLDLNLETLEKTFEWLGLKIEIIKESELKAKGASTERLINICKEVGADTYVSGVGAREYMEEKLFEKHNIKLSYQKYIHPKYPQRFSESFIEDLSIIDLLSNVGPDSLSLLKGEFEYS